MVDTLYNTDILSLAANIKHAGSLASPTGTSRKVSKLCGSWVEIDVIMDSEIVSDFAIRLQACALGQASAAILSENVIGATREEIIEARHALSAMLKSDELTPMGRFSKLGLLLDVKSYPARHASTLLAFEAAVEASAQ